MQLTRLAEVATWGTTSHVIPRGPSPAPETGRSETLVGAALLGMLGALLAIPAAASVQLALSGLVWRRRIEMVTARRAAEHAREAEDSTPGGLRRREAVSRAGLPDRPWARRGGGS